MDPTTTLFRAAEARLRWLSERQAVLAENIANADTPHWRPRDLPTFDAALATASQTLSITNARHLTGRVLSPVVHNGSRPGSGGERAPDGNAVELDQQLAAAAATDSQHALVVDLYHKYVGLFKTALGK
jgi:flagellar basal-body rod protein FlgB